MGLIRMTVPTPQIVESFSGPEFFADGTLFLDRGEIITMIHYVERYGTGGLQNIEVVRVHRSRRNWIESLHRANALLMAGVAH